MSNCLKKKKKKEKNIIASEKAIRTTENVQFCAISRVEFPENGCTFHGDSYLFPPSMENIYYLLSPAIENICL